MSSLLSALAITGGYHKASVLRDVQIDLSPGEMVAVFGTNGAGKTTLLRALCGALPVCRGHIFLDGARVDHLSIWGRARLGLVHVPEGRHVFPSMTVRDNLEAGTLASKTPTPIQEIFDLFPKLYERQRQQAGTLSGGEQQMVAIGRALASAPKVMLIDEMSAGLAPIVTDRLVDGLVRIRQRGVAILLVEQAPHFVAEVVDRAYLLEQGRIVGAGSLDELGGSVGIANSYLGVS